MRPEVKTCNRCQATLESFEFSPAARTADGYSPWCRCCHSEHARQWSRDNRARANANKAALLNRNPEARAARQAKNAEWRESYRANSAERAREWRRNNPDAERMHGHVKRARKKAATVHPFTAEQLIQRLAMFAGRCWMCGKHADQVDHVKPIARGGPHMLANLRPACGSCNNKKKAAWPVDTRIYRGDKNGRRFLAFAIQ